MADRAIMDAIVELLIERGYREVTIEGVAARAGVAKTTIYRRWPSKADMVVEAVCCAGKDCPVEAACDGFEPVVCGLERMLSALSCSQVAKIVSGLAVEMPHNAELAETVRERLVKPNRAAMCALLRQGVASGELRADLDPEFVADLLVGPLFFRMLISGEPLSPELPGRTVSELLRGIGAERARESAPGLTRGFGGFG